MRDTMPVRFYYGHDRLPLAIGGLSLPGRAGATPYFGIAPLSWVGHAWTSDAEGAELWARSAPLFDRALSGAEAVEEPRLAALLELLRRNAVVPFATAAAAAVAAVRNLWPEEGAAAGGALSLWCLREGQVASVWHCRRTGRDGEMESLAVNVARDAIAGRRLAASGDVLRACADGPIAAVRDLQDVDVMGLAVTCLVQDWVGGAREIGFCRGGPAGPGLVAIERFLTDQAVPAKITGVEAERLTAGDWDALVRAVAALARKGTAGIEIPAFSIDRGDFVETPQGPRLVACSGDWESLPGVAGLADSLDLHRAIDRLLRERADQGVAYVAAA